MKFRKVVWSAVFASQVRISKHLADQEQIFFGTSLAYDKVISFKIESS